MVAAPPLTTTADESNNTRNQASWHTPVRHDWTNSGRKSGESWTKRVAERAGWRARPAPREGCPCSVFFCSNSEHHRHRCLALLTFSSLRSQGPCGRASLRETALAVRTCGMATCYLLGPTLASLLETPKGKMPAAEQRRS